MVYDILRRVRDRFWRMTGIWITKKPRAEEKAQPVYPHIAPASLEYVPCNLCGSDDTEVLFRKKTVNLDLFPFDAVFTYVRCLRCGLVYVNPRLRSEETGQIYEQALYFLRVTQDRSKLARYLWVAQARLDELERNCSVGKLLDVGCSIGLFLLLAQQRGWNAIGVDPSMAAATFAQDRFGLTVHPSTLAQAGLPSSSFDVITFYNTLEHLRDPKKELLDARTLLKPDGMLVLEVPTIDNPYTKLIGADDGALIPEEHLYMFSVSTITRLLETVGFNIIRFRGGFLDTGSLQVYAKLSQVR